MVRNFNRLIEPDDALEKSFDIGGFVESMRRLSLIPGHLTDGSMGLGGGNSTMDI